MRYIPGLTKGLLAATIGLLVSMPAMADEQLKCSIPDGIVNNLQNKLALSSNYLTAMEDCSVLI